MAGVVLESLRKEFGDVIAVNDINLEVKDREFLVLVGPSGCGKSTTLRCIAGLEEITSGNVAIGERIVNDVPPKDRDIAMVFQNYALYPHMNVYDNMAFGLRLRKFPKREVDERVKEAADILGIGALLERRPKELSGGQRQRVALGRAIVREPQVFLMDEPLSNLDAKLRVHMRVELSRLQEQLQTTTIYVTHDQTEAMTMGDRIVVMDEGIIQQVDSPQRLYDDPNNMFVGGFIGSPPMNFMGCELRFEGRDAVLDGDTFTMRMSNGVADVLKGDGRRDVVLGIRPENIHVDSEYIEAHADTTMETTVTVVEPMGAEIFLYLNNGDNHEMTARVKTLLPQTGDSLRVAFDPDKICLFDAETEERLC